MTGLGKTFWWGLLWLAVGACFAGAWLNRGESLPAPPTLASGWQDIAAPSQNNAAQVLLQLQQAQPWGRPAQASATKTDWKLLGTTASGKAWTALLGSKNKPAEKPVRVQASARLPDETVVESVRADSVVLLNGERRTELRLFKPEQQN